MGTPRTTTPTNPPLVLSLLFLWTSLFLTGTLSAAPHNGSLEKICSVKERNSLLEFKAKVLDPNGILSSWTGGDCCRWKGIGCDESGGVVNLDLHNPNATDPSNFDFYSFGLSGEIDPSLLSLQKLQNLDLSGNDFSTSSFPSFIGSFKELRHLNLSLTSLVGVLPSQFGNLTSLKFLDLSYNFGLTLAISGGLSFLTRLSSLQYIDMTGINLSDHNTTDLFQMLNSLPSISVIRLKQCVISSIPESLFPNLNFKNLTVLVLDGNPMVEIKFPNWLFMIDTLEHLDLGNTNSDTLSSSDLNIIPVAIGNLYRLKFLDLSGNSLSGSIPDSIGNLSFLQEIHLNDNNLVGSIPESIGRGLPSLRRLDFSNNQLGGSIPESVGRISSLQQLDLSDNTLSGPIPASIGNLSSLQEFKLQSNQLSSLIPSSLGMLKSLEILDLSKNRFNGSIPESLCGLRFVRTLELSWNDGISGSIPGCIWGLERIETLGLGGKGLQGVLSESHFSKLRRLDSLTVTTSKSMIVKMSDDWIPPFSLSLFYMYSCQLGPRFPMWLRTQDKLVGLSLQDVGLSENLPVWIWNFSSMITVIEMPRNEMKGKLPNATHAPSLSNINLSNNKLEGSNWLFNISEMMPSMRFLSLAVNNLSGTIPPSLCDLYWERFDLSVNNFFGKIPDCLMKVQSYLNLASNNLRGSFPTSINGSQCSLISLHLDNNRLSGTLPISLKNCNGLTILDLGYNKFTGEIPTWIGESMSSLKILTLRSNKFNGSIPAMLLNLSNLQILDLSYNYITGSIPSSIGNLTAMKYRHLKNESFGNYDKENVSVVTKGKDMSYTEILSLVTSIDLSSNELTGVIPDEIGDLLGLSNLNLSINHLSGGIPGTINRLKALETLDLSRNDLSGGIPQSMSMMTALNHLNLSLNNFSGRIPVGYQFNTFTDPSIFMGNQDLCGPPLKTCDVGRSPNVVGKQTEGGDEKEMRWFYLSTILGFTAGFWMFYATLIFKKAWKNSYYLFLDEFNDLLYVKYHRFFMRSTI